MISVSADFPSGLKVPMRPVPQAPRSLQDNKTDFQKQNIKKFQTSFTSLVRGWVTTGDWTGPFLRLSYEGGPDSPLWKGAGGPLGPDIRLWIKVGGKRRSGPSLYFTSPRSR
jgi:hypothetical protein